jgi:hypothetical protein
MRAISQAHMLQYTHHANHFGKVLVTQAQHLGEDARIWLERNKKNRFPKFGKRALIFCGSRRILM